MNRVGLKDYLLNHADDSDLLDCAKAWDAANEYGQFDTYSSVGEAAQANGWDAAQALSEARRVDQDADFFRFNGYGHLESVSKASLLEDARDNIDDIIDWLDSASCYELEGISSDIELMVDAKDPLEVINEVDCSSHNHGNDIEVNLSRGCDKATLSFSKLDDIDADKIDLANAAYAAVENYYKYADGRSTEEVQAKFRNEHGRGLSAERADQLTAACEKNMDALKRVLDDDEIEALEKLFNVELCSETYCATLANEALGCKYISSALEKMGFDVENGRACVEMRQLTDKGERLYSDYQMDGGFYLPEDGVEAMGFVYREGDENAFIHDLWDNPEMCSKPRFAEKVGGSPAEEYIMEHDGVKTEFQITEVKQGSFAYDQGARFDVKVLTDGHDCGNGRFCADLGEAHDFCGQFANDIAGLGESLDDMCEDRSEVASAVQDAHTGERYHEDEQRNNSEIGD